MRYETGDQIIIYIKCATEKPGKKRAKFDASERCCHLDIGFGLLLNKTIVVIISSHALLSSTTKKFIHILD